MQKVGLLLPPLLGLCVDACVTRGVRVLQLSPLLLPHPFLALWGGALARACALALVPSGGWVDRESLAVLCLHYPAYSTLLWAMGRPIMEQLWGWHSWERLFQGYAVTAVARLYWNRAAAWRTKGAGPPGKGAGPDPAASLRRLLGYMRPHAGRFAAVLTLVVLSSYGEMAVPKYTGHITDWINQDAPDAFSQAITVMTLLTVASAVLEFVCDLMYNITMSLIHTSVQAAVFQAVLKQEIAFFDASPTGELVSRITTDTNDMSEALSEKLSLLMWYSARFGFLLYFMLSQSWQMTLLTCMGLPIIWVIPELTGHFHQTIAARVQESLAKANQVATETFSCMKTVRSFANEDGETEKYRRRLEDTYGLKKQEAAAYAASTCANSMTTLALKVCILYYGGTLVTMGTVSSGELVSFVLYELQFASAVEAVMRSYPEVKKAIGASEKIFEYLDRDPRAPPSGSLAPERLSGHVQFRNVKFSYSGKTDENSLVLKDVSLELKPGRVTALVGLNRSGKSTCVKLLERFYQPQNGEILLDGKPLHSYRDDFLHQQIAVVSQECVLFARSVRENITYGYENATEEEVYRAARMASAHGFIQELSSGYHTDAGEKGGQVSGGQKQRIAIARALIRNPKILILDNATSDLDTENEHQVHEALFGLNQSCSVLMISNKMSVAEKASHIVLLHEGRVQEEGSHAHLMARGGLYAQLVEKQKRGFDRPGEANDEDEQGGEEGEGL